MALRKCPRCELNYIKGDAPLCNVCMNEKKRTDRKKGDEIVEPITCTECGEAPAVPGYELCAECLKEQKRQQELENAGDLLDDDAIDELESEEGEE